MDLDNNNHSVFLMKYQLILVIKYRRQLIDEAVSNRLKEIFVNFQSKYNIKLQEWHHNKDHVQVLFKAHPNTELSKFINAYKSASSRLIKKEFPTILKALWKEEAFWSRSFCLFTIGEASDEVIQQYIKTQGENKMKSKQAVDLRDNE